MFVSLFSFFIFVRIIFRQGKTIYKYIIKTILFYIGKVTFFFLGSYYHRSFLFPKKKKEQIRCGNHRKFVPTKTGGAEGGTFVKCCGPLSRPTV